MSNAPNPTWQRLEAGRQAKAAQGGYAGYGSPPFGVRTVNGQLVADEREQKVIELIRRHHKSGKSLQQIANWLNTHGYPTKRGQQWKRISVKRVLDRLYGKNPRIANSARQSARSASARPTHTQQTGAQDTTSQAPKASELGDQPEG